MMKIIYMVRTTRKRVFGVSDQNRAVLPQKMMRLEISDLGIKAGCTVFVAKTKALISWTVIALLIFAFGFVFAYAKNRFPHEMADIVVLKFSNFIRLWSNILTAKNLAPLSFSIFFWFKIDFFKF